MRELEHGTNHAYVKHCCRCQQCREAHAKYYREGGYNERTGKRGDSKRRWDLASREVCQCGRFRERTARLCQSCRREEVAQQTQERRELIQQLWLEGLLSSEIALRLGYGSGESLRQEIIRMRRSGWDVPYRPHGRRKVLA